MKSFFLLASTYALSLVRLHKVRATLGAISSTCCARRDTHARDNDGDALGETHLLLLLLLLKSHAGF